MSVAFLLSIEHDDAVIVGAAFMLGAFLAGFSLFGLRLDRRPSATDRSPLNLEAAGAVRIESTHGRDRTEM